MGLLLAILLTMTVAQTSAQPPASTVVKDQNTILRSGCSIDAPPVASLAAGTPLKLRYALSGESVPCYKVAVDMGGRQIDGYLPASAIEGLDTFDKNRKDAAWVTTNEALNAVRAMPSLDALKAPEGGRTPLPDSLKVVLAQAEQLIDANQPQRALMLLEPEIQKRRDPVLLSMAGVAAWRADEARRALEYWRESLELAPNPDLEKLYKRVEKERTNDQSGEKLYGVRVVLRYDRGTVPVDTARGMVTAVDSAFARVSAQLGCFAEEKIVTIIQSRDAYKKATDAACWKKCLSSAESTESNAPEIIHRLRAKFPPPSEIAGREAAEQAELTDLRSEGDVVNNGFIREQRILLRHVAATAIGLKMLPALYQDMASAGALRAQQQPQQCGFSTTCLAQHADELAFLDL
jgi:hypothetical protein